MADKIMVMPCGCRVAIDYDGSLGLVYCPLHKSAPALYKALVAFGGRITHASGCNRYRFKSMTNIARKTMEDCGFNNDCDCGLEEYIKMRDKALAKAGG